MLEHPIQGRGSLAAGPLLFLAALPIPLVWFALYGASHYLLALVLYHTLCFGAFALCGAGSLRSRSSLIPYVTAALGFAVVATLVVGWFADIGLIRVEMVRFGFVSSHLPFLIGYFLLVHPLAEEAFWRGTIYHRLAQLISPASASALSSVLFGAWHAVVLWAFLPGLWWLGALGVAFFGVAMVAMYVYNDRHLLPGTVFHAVGGDVPLLLVLGFAVLG